MAEDLVAHVERLEKAHLKLLEKHTKSCDDISQMMKMLKMLTREKQTAETLDPQAETTPLRGAGEDILYLQGSALPHETQATYISPSQTFPFNYGPLQGVNTLGMVMHEPKTGTDPWIPWQFLISMSWWKGESCLKIKP